MREVTLPTIRYNIMEGFELLDISKYCNVSLEIYSIITLFYYFSDRRPVPTHLPLACSRAKAQDEEVLMAKLDELNKKNTL